MGKENKSLNERYYKRSSTIDWGDLITHMEKWASTGDDTITAFNNIINDESTTFKEKVDKLDDIIYTGIVQDWEYIENVLWDQEWTDRELIIELISHYAKKGLDDQIQAFHKMDEMRGGRAEKENMGIDDVDPNELELGIAVEMEHTDNPEIAKEIALDHLAENGDYYTLLMRDTYLVDEPKAWELYRKR